jgi:hypothetical protein
MDDAKRPNMQPLFTAHLIKLCGKLSSFLILLGEFITYAPGANLFQSDLINTCSRQFAPIYTHTSKKRGENIILISPETMTIMFILTHEKTTIACVLKLLLLGQQF